VDAYYLDGFHGCGPAGTRHGQPGCELVPVCLRADENDDVVCSDDEVVRRSQEQRAPQHSGNVEGDGAWTVGEHLSDGGGSTGHGDAFDGG
jgi:hypothetical protein